MGSLEGLGARRAARLAADKLKPLVKDLRGLNGEFLKAGRIAPIDHERGVVDDQAADRRERQDFRAVHRLHELLPLGHNLTGDTPEDRLPVLRDAAVGLQRLGGQARPGRNADVHSLLDGFFSQILTPLPDPR